MSRSAATPDERENQLIAMAYDLAEKQIREGTASAMVLTHFLKMGTSREKLEREIMGEQKKLVTAKTESIEAQRQSDIVYEEIINAMKRYSGADMSNNEEIEI